MITQEFLELGSQRVFLYSNRDTMNRKNLIIFKGAHSSKPGITRNLISLCETNGINVFRCDYVNQGDSYHTINLEDATGFEEAIYRIFDHIRSSVEEEIYVLGVGLGSYIACLLHDQPRVAGVLLVEPLEAGGGLQPGGKVEDLRPFLREAGAEEVEFDIGESLSTLLEKCTTIRLGGLRNGCVFPLEQVANSQDASTRIGQLCEDIVRFINEGEPAATTSDPPEVPTTLPSANDLAIRPVRFDVGGDPVLGILHRPESVGTDAPCIIYQPGLGGERVDSYRCGLHLGFAAADRGVATLRYDNRGAGLSGGDFADTTWERSLEDLEAAIAVLGQQPGVDSRRIWLVSNSAGACAACRAANQFPQVEKVVLWSPFLLTEAAETTVRPRFFRDPKGRLVMPYWGDTLGAQYLQEQKRGDFFGEFERCEKKMLVICGAQDQVISDTSKQVLRQVCATHPNRYFYRLPGGHQFSQSGFVRVIRLTLDWLQGI